MGDVGQIERITQNRVVKLFKNKLNYTYLGDLHDRENNKNIEDEYLIKFLAKKGYSKELINKAITEFKKTAEDQSKSLYDVNKETYKLLRYGVNIKENIGEHKKTIYLIDWENPLENDFYFAEEVTVKGRNTKRPDIVIYINGIAVGVIELKRSTVSINEGIRQNLDNQKPDFIERFFSTIQLTVAGNDTEGAKYGTIETKEKYYLTWKEETNPENIGKIRESNDKLYEEIQTLISDENRLLDKQLIGLFHKERLIEIIHEFIVYDRGIKKLCRPNQYFGIRLSRDFIRRKEGGIIWHTQGSGKSLSMVWCAKWIKETNPEARILIITDREELDEQIEKVFFGVDEEIYRTKSGQDLLNRINETSPILMCSLIHKFGRKEELEYEEYIEEIKRNIPSNFKPKGDIFVFVDECHRTQSGKLHSAMKTILPNSMFIGFTGTPLLKKDKQKSIEIFGRYIHTYKFDEAVNDKVVLDLRYEARKVDQDISSQKKVDDWFEAKTKGLSDYAKVKLKQKWGNMQSILSSESRLTQIVKDIILDMEIKPRLENGRGNAILVAGSIYEACKYHELFVKSRFKKCAIITSYTPNSSDIKGEASSIDEVTGNMEKYEIYINMIAEYFKVSKEEVKEKTVKYTENFEKEVKNKFIKEPAQMKLLIVVDKLLTGFDAPSATYLYIDKKMRDHNLFQAICRVNRLDNDDKEYGYIVDYKDLFKNLERSISDYTGEAFEDYEEDDIKGLLSDRIEKGKEKLDDALETIRALCEPVELPKATINYIDYFVSKDNLNKEEIKENEHKRQALYKSTVSLLRAYANIANEMEEAGYSKEETEKIKEEVKYYDNIRHEIMLASAEYIDLKQYEVAMRHLFDRYLKADESEIISELDNFTIVELLVEKGISAIDELPEGIKGNKEAAAETIENNVRKLIIDEMPTNPKYFEKMSELLDELIRERKEEIKDYEEYLEKIRKLAENIVKPDFKSKYPLTINTSGKRALYDNLDKDENLVEDLHKSLIEGIPDGWKSSRIKERVVRNILLKYLKEEKIDEILEMLRNQGEY